MIEPTREQEAAVEFVSAWYGAAHVAPSRLSQYTSNIVITGMTDDIERSAWMITPSGAVANVAWMDDALTEYLKTIPAQRPPMLVPRHEQTA